MEKFGGRKFIFATVLTVFFGIFTVVGKMTVDQFMVATLTAYGLFAGANALKTIK